MSKTMLTVHGEAAPDQLGGVNVSLRGDGPAITVELASEAPVTLEWSDGLSWVTTPARLRDAGVTALDAQTGALATRAGGEVALRVVRLLDTEVLDLGLRAALECFEDVTVGATRLVAPGGEPVAGPVPPGRVLVLVHGVATSSGSAFGALLESDSWARLVSHYEGRVYALEHRSLTGTPVDAALALLDALGDAPRIVDLLTHGSGGLVGELLLAGDGAAALTAPRDPGPLTALLDRLADSKVRIGRFVRVACPVRGTALLSRRMDVALNLVLRGVSMAVGATSPLAAALFGLLRRVVAERADPDVAPGLACLAPDSPLVAFLDRVAEPKSDDPSRLYVVTGDSGSNDVVGRIAMLAPDLLFAGANDLAVDTVAMSGGVRRCVTPSILRTYAPPGLNHWSYFERAEVRAFVEASLVSLDTRSPADFPREGLDPESGVAPPLLRGDRDVIVVLPGFPGSHLLAGQGRAWLNFDALFHGAFGDLALDAPVSPDRIFHLAYGAFCTAASRHYDVVPFPYDWRHSVRVAAGRLAEVVAEHRGRGARVHLVAHSTGGLVARGLVAWHPDTWTDLVAVGGRLVLAGTPLRGTFAAAQTVWGGGLLMGLLAAIDQRHDQAALAGLVRTFPCLLELLPDRVDGQDGACWDPAWWAGFDDPAGHGRIGLDPGRLAAAAATRAELAAAPLDPLAVRVLLGARTRTLAGAGANGGDMRFYTTRDGDGTVTWASCEVEGVRPYLVDAEHAWLLDHRAAFPEIFALLEGGDCGLDRPVGGGGARVLEQPAGASHYPTPIEVTAAALSLGRTLRGPVD